MSSYAKCKQDIYEVFGMGHSELMSTVGLYFIQDYDCDTALSFIENMYINAGKEFKYSPWYILGLR